MKRTHLLAFGHAGFNACLRLFVFLAIFLGLRNGVSAQRNLALYNLQGIPQSYGLNPGRMPMSNMYITMPAIGNINANYSNSGFNFSALFPETPDGEDDMEGDESNFFDNDFQALLSGMGENNRMLLDLQAGWLDLGFRVGRNFFNISVTEQVSGEVRFPRALFDMINEVDMAAGGTFIRSYDLTSFNVNAQHYRAYGLGYTRQITPKLSAGLKAKMLTGFGNMTTENDNFSIVNNSENSILGIRGSLGIYTAGFATLENNSSAYFQNRGNSGMAFDVGASYSPLDKLEVFASVLNIGSINWKTDLTFDGIIGGNFEFPTNDIDAFEAEVSRLLDSLSTSSTAALPAYRTQLPMMGYLGANYYVGSQTAVGLLVNPRFFNGEMDLAFSMGVQTRLRRFLQLGVSYSMYNGSAFNLGAGLGLNLGPMQIFAATDNLLAAFNYRNANNFHVNTGLSFAFGRRTRDEQLALWIKSKDDEEDDENARIAISGVEGEEDGTGRIRSSGGKRTKRTGGSAIVYLEGDDADSADAAAKTKTAKTKTTRAKAGKSRSSKSKMAREEPVKTAERSVQTAAATTANTPASAKPALKRYFALRGEVRAQANGALITGVQVDAYVQLPGGGEELAYTRNFFTGTYEVLMDRSKTYRIVIRKAPFADEQTIILPGDMEGKNEIERHFYLK